MLFCDEYPDPRLEDKFPSTNQIDGISIAGGGKWLTVNLSRREHAKYGVIYLYFILAQPGTSIEFRPLSFKLLLPSPE